MGKPISTNKKAYRDYFLTDNWECGIALVGSEVKSIRAGEIAFKDAFARVDKGEVLLYNFHIAQYANASHANVDSDRTRRLLLHKKEIRKIDNQMKQQNLTLVPTKIYFNKRGLIKVEIALGRGKKMFDKRETIKKRKIDRDIGRALRHRQ